MSNHQLEDKQVYTVSTIFKSLERISKREDLSGDKLNYILAKDPKVLLVTKDPQTLI